MKIYFVRHGETDANRDYWLSGGSFDVPINAKGIKQATALKKKLPDDYDAILASSMLRTRQTADILFGTDALIEYFDTIIEKDFGDYVKKTWKELGWLKEDGTKNFTLLDNFPFETVHGESETEFRKRIQQFIHTVLEKYSGQTPIVVTHGMVITALYDMYPQKNIAVGHNASIHEFHIS